MSNYVKIVDFAAKDALGTGNPAKIVKGTEIDTEYANIATAVATKEDTANKNVASGYAGLDSGSRLAKSNQHASTAYVDSAANFTSGLQSAGSNVVTASNLLTSVLAVDGAGSGLDADLLDGQSSAAFALASHVHSAADITSSTFADARIAASNVTQHQASITLINAAATINGFTIGYRQIPVSATTSGSIPTTDVAKCVPATAGVTIPNSTFAAGDAVSIYNNSASSFTITASITTLRLAGTTSTGNRTLAPRGMCTVWFLSATEGVISGSGLS